MSVLVTGGAGYIGGATVDALLARGERVVVLDDLSTGHLGAVASGAEFERADVGDAEKLRRLIPQHDVRLVIHFAALTSTTESVRHPGRYFQTNAVKTLTLLEAMREAEVKSMVFSSTAAVYGDPQSVPIDERHPTGPINPYGCSKLMAEQMIEAYGKAHGIRCVTLRYFNAAGGSPVRGEDHRPETHLIPLALRAALTPGFEIKTYGVDYPTPDGTCVRDYIHIEDLAAAHLLAMDYLKGRDRGEGATLNLGIGRGYSVREVVETAREVTGHAIPTIEVDRRPGDPAQLVASSDLARERLGWEPKYPHLRDIIASAWEWHSAHPKGYGD